MEQVQQILKNIELPLQNKEEYSYFLTHSIRYAWVLEKIALISEGKNLRILDIGCFPYHIGNALEQMGHTVYGIASDHEPVKKKNIAILDIEESKFPYKSNFFDVVLMSEVIEHLPHSPLLAIQESKRVLKKEGKIIVTTPNIARSINRIKLLVGKNVMYPIDVYFENNGRGNSLFHRHNREYIKEELVELFNKTKWNAVEGGFFISYTPNRKRLVPDAFFLKLVKYVNFFLMKSTPSLQDSLYIIAEK